MPEYLVDGSQLIGSGNGLVLSGNKPLPEPVDEDLWCHMTSPGHNEFIMDYKVMIILNAIDVQSNAAY